MKNNKRFDFKQFDDYKVRIIDDRCKEMEKFDANRKLKKSFNDLLFKATTTHFPENNKKHD